MGTLMVLGGVLVAIGVVLCYTTTGEYYNADEVQAMVAAEVLEEERKKKLEAEATEAALREELDQELGEELGEENQMEFDAEDEEEARQRKEAALESGLGEPEMTPPAPVMTPATTKKKRRGPIMAN